MIELATTIALFVWYAIVGGNLIEAQHVAGNPTLEEI